jgi:hypothetical protein
MILPSTFEAKGKGGHTDAWGFGDAHGGPHGNARGGLQRGLPQQMREKWPR